MEPALQSLGRLRARDCRPLRVPELDWQALLTDTAAVVSASSAKHDAISGKVQGVIRVGGSTFRKIGHRVAKTSEVAMPPKPATTAVIGKTLEERREGARDAALKEMKALRADLAALEAVLTGKRKKGDFSLFDVIHGAFEIFRHAAASFEAEEMLEGCAREIESARALEYLQKHGATELVKPAGWHWISPRGEMHYLGKAEDTEKAAEKLAAVLQNGRRPKRKDKPESSADGTAPGDASPNLPEGESA